MEETEVVIYKNNPKEWESFVIRGIVALIIGTLVLIWPGITLNILMILFGVMAVIAGVMLFVFGSTRPVGETNTTLTMFLGILIAVLGAVAIIMPTLMAVALVYLLAALALLVGLADIWVGLVAVDGRTNRILLGLSGALSVILGGIFLAFPLLGGIVLVALFLGVFVIVFGVLSIAAGISLRRYQRED